MLIKRLPRSELNTYEKKHEEYVANVGARELAVSISENREFHFNITKQDNERAAYCTAILSTDDLVEITKATANRFNLLNKAIEIIEKINESKTDSNFKYKSIKEICDGLKNSSKLPEIKLD